MQEIESHEQKIKSKKEEENKKEKTFTTSNTSSNANNMESMATNLAIGDVPRITIKKKIMKRKMNIKIRSLMVYATTVVRRGK